MSWSWVIYVLSFLKFYKVLSIQWSLYFKTIPSAVTKQFVLGVPSQLYGLVVKTLGCCTGRPGYDPRVENPSRKCVTFCGCLLSLSSCQSTLVINDNLSLTGLHFPYLISGSNTSVLKHNELNWHIYCCSIESKQLI